MNTKKAPEFSHDEVNRLAFLNWEKDGCPHGRADEYWMEAECQLRATWHLLVKEHAPRKSRKLVRARKSVTITLKALSPEGTAARLRASRHV